MGLQSWSSWPWWLLFATAAAATSGVVQMSVQMTRPPVVEAVIDLSRRDSVVLPAINNLTGGGYYTTIGVGTPPQNISVMLDTGSSDTWVVSKSASACRGLTSSSRRQGGCGATYDSTSSSTYAMVSPRGFDITYLDGTEVQGDYITDSVTVDGKTVTKQQLGLALSTARGFGLMGLGFPANEATRHTYPTLVDNLVSQGLIARRAFSLYLNDLEAAEGTILFGGVDTDKYIGKLVTVPLVQDYASLNFTSYTVASQRVAISYANGSSTALTASGFSASTVLDSGSTLSLLPDTLFTAVSKLFNVVSYQEYALVDCSVAAGSAGSQTAMVFDFGNATIRVPLAEMVLDILGSAVSQSLQGLLGFQRVCIFGVQSAASYGMNGNDFMLLGDTFLRSAYVVYDQQGLQVGLAQANLNSTSSNVVAMSSGDATLPTATGVASQGASGNSPSTTTGTGGSGSGGASGTSTTSVSTSPTKNAAPRSTVGGGTAGGMGVLALTGLFMGLGALAFTL